MANDLNRQVMIGRLTADPEKRYTPSGTVVTSFTIANNRSWKDKSGETKEDVSFFKCICWGALGEKVVAVYGKKGMRVAVEGRLNQRSWEDQSGNKRSVVEIIVDNFQMLEKRDGTRNIPSDDYQDSTQSFSDDDIPF